MRPQGLVTREHLAAEAVGRYDYALRQKQAGRSGACKDALTRRVEDSIVTTLASHAMERAADDLYDPS